MSIEKYIHQLLHDHACVIVPDLGGFLVNAQRAYHHPVTNDFSPPGSTLGFNKNLAKSDGLLYNTIASTEGIAFSAAEERVDHFVKEVKKYLFENKSYIIPQIGKLYYDIENNLQFTPDTAVNYDAKSFGLPKIVTPPVVRSTSIKLEDRKVVVHREKKAFHLPAYAAAAVMALLIGFVGVFLLSTQESRTGEFASNMLDSVTGIFKGEPETPPAIATEEETETDLSTFDVSGMTSSVFESINEIKAFEASRSTTAKASKRAEEWVQGERYYHIVIGMFQNKSNADKMAERASTLGYHPIAKTGRKYHRVVLKFSRNDIQPKQALSAVRSEIERGAWIWENRNR